MFPKNGGRKEYPARRIEKIIILRPSSISTGAVQLAIEHDIDIVYLGSFGKPVGRIFPSNPKGITELRRAQLATASSHKAFELAEKLVIGKAQNQIEYLKFLQWRYANDLSQEITKAETILESLNLVRNTPRGREQLFGMEYNYMKLTTRTWVIHNLKLPKQNLKNPIHARTCTHMSQKGGYVTT